MYYGIVLLISCLALLSFVVGWWTMNLHHHSLLLRVRLLLRTVLFGRYSRSTRKILQCQLKELLEAQRSWYGLDCIFFESVRDHQLTPLPSHELIKFARNFDSRIWSPHGQNWRKESEGPELHFVITAQTPPTVSHPRQFLDFCRNHTSPAHIFSTSSPYRTVPYYVYHHMPHTTHSVPHLTPLSLHTFLTCTTLQLHHISPPTSHHPLSRTTSTFRSSLAPHIQPRHSTTLSHTTPHAHNTHHTTRHTHTHPTSLSTPHLSHTIRTARAQPAHNPRSPTLSSSAPPSPTSPTLSLALARITFQWKFPVKRLWQLRVQTGKHQMMLFG